MFLGDWAHHGRGTGKVSVKGRVKTVFCVRSDKNRAGLKLRNIKTKREEMKEINTGKRCQSLLRKKQDKPKSDTADTDKTACSSH